eukprot:729238-Amphidinium_carterae.1
MNSTKVERCRTPLGTILWPYHPTAIHCRINSQNPVPGINNKKLFATLQLCRAVAIDASRGRFYALPGAAV